MTPEKARPAADAGDTELFHVYFSPHGGDIYSVVPHADGVEEHLRDFERHLDYVGHPWKHRVVTEQIHHQSHRMLLDHDNPDPVTKQAGYRAVAYGPAPQAEEKDRRIASLEKQLRYLTENMKSLVSAAVTEALTRRGA